MITDYQRQASVPMFPGFDLRRGMSLSKGCAMLLCALWLGGCEPPLPPEPVLVETPVTDWSFVAEAEGCELVLGGADAPRRVEVHCFLVGKQLYIGCTDCDAQPWARDLLTDPDVRVSIDSMIYPVVAKRMSDEGAVQRAYRLSRAQSGQTRTDGVPPGYALFHLKSRRG